MSLLDQIVSSINRALERFTTPGEKREWLESNLLPAILGNVPDYSSRRRYQIADVTAATICSHTTVYFYDALKPDPILKTPGTLYVVMPEVKNRKVPDKKAWSLFGGYVNLDAKEQPREAARRELNEELIDPESGAPLLSLNTSRFVPSYHGIDYSETYKFPVPTADFINGLELNRHEFESIRQLQTRLAKSPQLRQTLFEKTNHEVCDIAVMPLSAALQMKPKEFIYPKMREYLEEFAENSGLIQPKAFRR